MNQNQSEIYVGSIDTVNYYVGTMTQLVEKGLKRFAPLSGESLKHLDRLKKLLGAGCTLTDLRVDPLP